MNNLAPLAEALYAGRLALLIGPGVDEAAAADFCSRLARCVQEMPIFWVLTTRVDTQLAHAFEQAGVAYEPVVRDDTLAHRDDTLPALVHLFGSPGEPEGPYQQGDTSAEERLLHDPRRAEVRWLLHEIFSRHVFLAYGCDLTAAWFQALRDSFSGSEWPRPVYLVVADAAEGAAWASPGVELLFIDPLGLLDGRRVPALPRSRLQALFPWESATKGALDPAEEELSFDILPSPPPPPPPAEVEFSPDIPQSLPDAYQALRIDAAAPERVTVGVSFVLAVAIRQPDAPILQEKDLTRVESGEAEVLFAAGADAVRLRLRVNAPACAIADPDTYAFRLRRGANPPPFYFHLTPQQIGPISILIQLFQEDEWLGGARLQAEADAVPAGAVTLQLRSQPLTAAADTAIKWQVQELEQQRDEARRYLLRLQAKLIPPPDAISQARIETEIDDTQARIRGIEEEIDALMTGLTPDT